MNKYNIITYNEAGERVFPQGVNWDKLIKKLTGILEFIGALLGVIYGVIIIINTGGGGGFRVKSITITPIENLPRN
jgi:hypothetical protein